MLLVALCKTALLVATLEACASGLGASAESCECETIDFANPTTADGSVSRIAGKRATRCLPATFVDTSPPAAPKSVTSPPAGHRLANGQCAPLRC